MICCKHWPWEPCEGSLVALAAWCAAQLNYRWRLSASPHRSSSELLSHHAFQLPSSTTVYHCETSYGFVWKWWIPPVMAMCQFQENGHNPLDCLCASPRSFSGTKPTLKLLNWAIKNTCLSHLIILVDRFPYYLLWVIIILKKIGSITHPGYVQGLNWGPGPWSVPSLVDPWTWCTSVAWRIPKLENRSFLKMGPQKAWCYFKNDLQCSWRNMSYYVILKTMVWFLS